jgi:hypothetical protein
MSRPSLSHGDGKAFLRYGKQRPHMSQTAPTPAQPPVSPGPTVERRIATALWNKDERDRIIAMKTYELFFARL